MLGLEFASGRLNIYDLTDDRTEEEKAAGGKPRQRLLFRSWTYYGDRTASYTRVYEARGADARFDRVVRIPAGVNIMAGDYVILEDGNQYRVDICSAVMVATNFRAIELTLVKLENRYDLILG